LVPTLRPGDIVVMDNLGCHKSAAVRAAIEAADAELRTSINVLWRFAMGRLLAASRWPRHDEADRLLVLALPGLRHAQPHRRSSQTIRLML
ncbi:MAG TPA: hypothetical protein VK844_02765, partial [Hyphomicrobiales bacterium]|nr:hypothetical protein [Hyphomicrobiales bacterium]